MKKYKAVVNVQYEFEFETNENKRHEIKELAEEIWEAKMSIGTEEEHFHDTVVEIKEIWE